MVQNDFFEIVVAANKGKYIIIRAFYEKGERIPAVSVNLLLCSSMGAYFLCEHNFVIQDSKFLERHD